MHTFVVCIGVSLYGNVDTTCLLLLLPKQLLLQGIEKAKVGHGASDNLRDKLGVSLRFLDTKIHPCTCNSMVGTFSTTGGCCTARA